MLPTELVPDGDAIHRQIDFPRMYTDSKSMIWEIIFQFPGGEPESVVWGKYAPTPEDVHRLGSERQARVRERNPDMRYLGFIPSTAGVIRAIMTRNGHSFSVCHAPEEGIHHAEISYKPGANLRPDQLKRSEKNELKLALRKAFGDLVPHSEN
ncbi:MAG TPA: hypothetical protein VHT52_18665 [Stellaceae bacterium]|jgi:hypothetical protein|nr:hypothetical protein [Stellaceae bacterium]